MTSCRHDQRLKVKHDPFSTPVLLPSDVNQLPNPPMKTRKTIIYGLLVVVAGIAIWYGTRRPSAQPTVRPASAETNQTSVASQNSQAAALPAATSDPTPESNPAAWIE